MAVTPRKRWWGWKVETASIYVDARKSSSMALKEGRLTGVPPNLYDPTFHVIINPQLPPYRYGRVRIGREGGATAES